MKINYPKTRKKKDPKPFCKRGHSRTPENLSENGTCLTCKAEQNLSGYWTNRDERLSHNQKYRRTTMYGLADGEYERIIAGQNNLCLVCGRPFVFESTGRHKFAPVIDHCHNSQKVRGILHNICNSGIGMLEDNPVFVDSAARYLRENG